jgi:hypothetical protein
MFFLFSMSYAIMLRLSAIVTVDSHFCSQPLVFFSSLGKKTTKMVHILYK